MPIQTGAFVTNRLSEIRIHHSVRNETMQRATLDRLIAILRSARDRKRMYFMPVGPVAATHWIHGLRIGCTFVGLQWSPEHRRPAVEKRGIPYFVAMSETKELKRRGLSPEAIVDELLSIEIEMWESHREQLP